MTGTFRHGSHSGGNSEPEFCRERTPWRSFPNVAYIPKSNGTQNPERHGVRSLQDNHRVATLTAGELNHAKKRRDEHLAILVPHVIQCGENLYPCVTAV
jgi:hypothetical protein